MTYYYIKDNVEQNEYNMHKHVYDLKLFHVPKIISYDNENKVMIMEKINGMNISDMYYRNGVAYIMSQGGATARIRVNSEDGANAVMDKDIVNVVAFH